jgi:hypothetical protein
MSFFRSYPKGSAMAGAAPADSGHDIAVNADWVLAHGNRAQRRRIKKALRSTTTNKKGKPA